MSNSLSQPFFSRQGLGFHLQCDWPDLKELADHVGRHYHSFDELQGSKWRHFDVPDKRLKRLQASIAKLIKLRINFPPTMLGGLKGGSPRKNAEAHVKNGNIFKLDIRDCFPSIGPRMVFKVFREQLGFSEELSNVLTKLTTFQRRLPQGSPASCVIANAVLLPLHERIRNTCAQFGVACTFFVDDITLSGERVREVAGFVIELVKASDFSMRAKKVRLLAAHREGQSVTGVFINGGRLSVGRERKNKIRAKIHQFSSRDKVTDNELRSLESSIRQVAYISKAQGAALTRLADLKLPSQVVTQKKQPVKRIRRPCTSTHKHRH